MATSALGKFFSRKRPAVDWARRARRRRARSMRSCATAGASSAGAPSWLPAWPWCRCPGIDWVTDVAVLMKLIPDINQAFGLTPEQIERLAPDRQIVVYKAISAGGGLLIGRLVTRELVMHGAAPGRRAADDATGRQVRADRRPGGLGRAHVLVAALCLRAAHPAMRRDLAPADAARADAADESR